MLVLVLLPNIIQIVLWEHVVVLFMATLNVTVVMVLSG